MVDIQLGAASFVPEAALEYLQQFRVKIDNEKKAVAALQQAAYFRQDIIELSTTAQAVVYER